MKRASRGADSELGGRKSEAGKSELTVLAERFKQQFCTVAESIGKDLNLNDVAQSLQVSRRRLYDIVNVLEALQMVSRNGKLTYRWKGTSHLPKLLAELYADAVAAIESGQGNPAVLEGHMPGSCWALTRRIVQQLLLDRGQVPLTVLVQRLESDSAAATDDSTVSKTSAATVERRIYDIGSVLSTYDLVAKTLQGGSGPRHRQPVYQWLYDWETHLPSGMLQTAAAGLPTMTDYAAMAATMPGMEHLQQWQEYQAAAAAAAAVGEAGAGCDASEAVHQQQQQLLQLAEYAAVQGASSAFWEQTAAAAQIQQQQQQSEQVPDDDLSAGATDAVQQRLQQVSVLVNTMLAEHGGKTCVTLSQLQGLLQQIQAGALHQDAAAVAAAVGQQQGQQYGDHDVASVDKQHEDQEQLDAAKCLQQLKAGAVWPEQPSISHQHQQQHAEDQNAQGSDDIRRSSKKRRVCTYPVPESNDQCCPGMTCLDFAAALRAVADSQLQQQPDGNVQQQSVGCRSPEEAGATKGSPATEDVCCVSTADGRARSHSCSKGNQVDADQEYAMFVAEEGEPGPGGRISSCSLNNSRDQSAMQELAAAAVASLQEQQQEQHTAADKPSSLDSNDDEAKTLQQQTVDTGCLGGLAAAVEQHQIEMAMPWVGASAAADRVKTGEPLDVRIATSVGTADSAQKVLSAGAQSAHPRQVLDLAQEDKQQQRIDIEAVSDSHNRDRMQSCALHAAGPGMERTADAAQQLHKAVSSRAQDDQQQQGCLSSPWQALQQLQQLTSVHSETSNLAGNGGSDGGGECSQDNCAVMPVDPYALKGCTTHGSGWSVTMPTAATTSTAPGLLQCQEQLLHHSQQYPLAAGGGVAVQGLLNCLPANLLAQVLQAQAK